MINKYRNPVKETLVSTRLELNKLCNRVIYVYICINTFIYLKSHDKTMFEFRSVKSGVGIINREQQEMTYFSSYINFIYSV